MATVEERLAKALDEMEARAEKAERALEDACERADAARAGWSLPHEIEDAPGLPVPRLEFAWTQDEVGSWSRYTCEYRLVMRHLTDKLMAIPLGRTSVSSGAGKAPWSVPLIDARSWLPFRDGAHALHDAAHLGLPLYAIGPDGHVSLTVDGHQADVGSRHRRAAERP